jgi:alpha-galactosidase
MTSHNKLSLDIKRDGSFSVEAPDLCLHGAYPAFNGIPIRPTAVTVLDSGIRYACEGGMLTLSFRSEGNALFIHSVLTGFEEAPHSIQPIGNARLSGAERFFRQGQGMGGPSGFLRFSEIMEPHQSYTVSGVLSAASSILTVASDDHRRFAQRTLFHAVRHQLTAQPVSMIEAGFMTESIPLEKQACHLPALRLAWAPSIRDGLTDCARYIATGMRARAPQPPSVHWCSWYYLYQNLSEEVLDDCLRGFARLRDRVRIDLIQIDAGYFPSNGDWLETTDDWPSGMEGAIRKIKDAGFRAGIWIGPYMVGNRSRLYREHPDWILRNLDGIPVAPWRRYGADRPWGYQDEETYVLDTSHPDAMAYLRTVFRTFRAWGIDFFKTDFMKWGLRDSTEVMRFLPGKTSVEYFRECLEGIRQEIGPESFWLGCISPYAPFIGYADAMRIAGDVEPGWSNNPKGFGPLQMIRESQPVQYFNNIWWQNDPDSAFVRNFHTYLSASETKAIALWQAMLGGTLYTSDPLHEVDEWGRELWRFMDLGPEPNNAILPFVGCDRKLLIAVRRYETENAWSLLALNPTDEPVTERIALKDAIGIDAAFIHTWGPGVAEPLGHQRSLVPELAAHAASLYYLSESELPPDACLTLGGARLPSPIGSCP